MEAKFHSFHPTPFPVKFRKRMGEIPGWIFRARSLGRNFDILWSKGGSVSRSARLESRWQKERTTAEFKTFDALRAIWLSFFADTKVYRKCTNHQRYRPLSHETATSLSCWQLWTPQPLCEHLAISVSVPLQRTLSNQICPLVVL